MLLEVVFIYFFINQKTELLLCRYHWDLAEKYIFEGSCTCTNRVVSLFLLFWRGCKYKCTKFNGKTFMFIDKNWQVQSTLHGGPPHLSGMCYKVSYNSSVGARSGWILEEAGQLKVFAHTKPKHTKKVDVAQVPRPKQSDLYSDNSLL